MNDRKAIRVKVFDHSEYVEVTSEMMTNFELFLRKVLAAFDIDSTQAGSAYLFDQDNFQIPSDLFPVVIPHFMQPSVYVRIVFSLHEDTGFDLTLEDFLKRNGCKSIFLMAEDATHNQKELDLKTLQYLAEKLIQFMEYRENFGEKVDGQQVADSIVRLMPCIKKEALYMHRKGVLYNKLFYKKYVKPNKKNVDQSKARNDADGQMEDAAVANISNQLEVMTLEEEYTYLLYFKTCLVEREMEILKIKLQKTIELREKTIKKRETKFIETFPFYFVAPDLVLYDYSIRFGNENYLIEKWPKFQMKILSSASGMYIDQCEHIGFDSETTSILLLQRLFSMRKTFEMNVDKLIVYSNDVNGCPENVINKKNIHPYIIAIGDDKEKITNYYIDIEEQLIPVPSGFNFVRTFDFLFKCHKIFHLEYNPVFKNMMNFIDFYVFEEEEAGKNGTVAMRKVAEKMNISELTQSTKV